MPFPPTSHLSRCPAFPPAVSFRTNPSHFVPDSLDPLLLLGPLERFALPAYAEDEVVVLACGEGEEDGQEEAVAELVVCDGVEVLELCCQRRQLDGGTSGGTNEP